VGSDTTLRDTTAARTPALPVDSGRPAADPSTPPMPSAPAPVPPATARRADTASTTAGAIVGDSGGIRIVGLPRGSTVMIDERPVTEAVTRLLPGPHAVGVSAPRFNFYSDTIVVRPGEITELSPPLTPLGAPVVQRQPAAPPRPAGRCAPGAGYNADGSCFDERPKPVNPPFVPVPEEVTGSPRPSLLWVKVSTEGRTVDVARLHPSNDSTFERAVRNFVWSVTWHPALKDGSPVEAWTQMLFPPAPK
jgi:PEGA domain